MSISLKEHPLPVEVVVRGVAELPARAAATLPVVLIGYQWSSDLQWNVRGQFTEHFELMLWQELIKNRLLCSEGMEIRRNKL